MPLVLRTICEALRSAKFLFEVGFIFPQRRSTIVKATTSSVDVKSMWQPLIPEIEEYECRPLFARETRLLFGEIRISSYHASSHRMTQFTISTTFSKFIGLVCFRLLERYFSKKSIVFLSENYFISIYYFTFYKFYWKICKVDGLIKLLIE